MRKFAIASAVTAVLGLASVSSAAFTVTDYWRMGEDNGTLPANNDGVTTVTQKDGPLVLNASTNNIPLYSTDAPTDSKADSVRSIAIPNTVGSSPTNWLQSATGVIGLGTGVIKNFGAEAWVKPNSISATANQTIFSIGGTSDTFALRFGYGAFTLRLTGGTNAPGNVGSGTDVTWSIPSSFTTADWNHVAVVSDDNGFMHLYVKGEEVSATSNALRMPGVRTQNSIQIGRASANPFAGKIDDVRLFTFGPGEFSTDKLLVTVPEPTMIGLLGVSVLGLLHRRRA